MLALEVRRDALERTRVVEADDPVAGDGEVVLAVQRFGLTANNVTYGLLGDMIGYWRFFAASAEGWGLVPAWGFARVTDSRADAFAEGDRFYGLVPMATHVVLRPERAERGAVDRAPHRAELPGVYNAYAAAATERLDEETILRPLFMTGLLLDAATAAFDAEQIVVTSASSRTASAFASFASQRDGSRLVGLTSARHRDFVRGLGVYDAVLGYDEVEALEERSSVLVDIAGQAGVRAAVHRRLGDRLRHSALVGAAHGATDGFTPDADLPGPRPELFFAPAHRPDRDPSTAWAEYCTWVDGWLTFEHHDGLASAQEVWAALAGGGGRPPSRADVVLPG